MRERPIVLDIRHDPYLDEVLRNHLSRYAAREGIDVGDLGDLLADAEDAVEFLREAGADVFGAYVTDLRASTGGVTLHLESRPRSRGHHAQ